MSEEYLKKLKNFSKNFGFVPGPPTSADVILSSLLSNFELFKLGAAFLSLVTLHAVAFSLHIPNRLWPLIDAYFLSTLTFSFILVFVFATFLMRLMPMVIRIVFLLVGVTVTLRHFPAIVWSRPRTIKSAREDLSIAARELRVISWRLNKKFSWHYDLISIPAFFSAFGMLYVGWSVLLIGFLLLAFLSYSVVSRLTRKETDCLGDLLFDTNSGRKIALDTVINNADLRSKIVLLLYLQLAVFSCLIGHFRFEFLVKSEPLLLATSSTSDAVSYIGSNATGLLVRSDDSGQIKFLTYGSAVSLE